MWRWRKRPGMRLPKKGVQTFHQRPFLNAERRDSHLGGWTSAFDKLAAYAAQIAKERSA